jgi:predicted  nucleic acid-binding Zn-ribbon protein
VRETKEVKELRSKILGIEMELCMISKDLERFKNELTHNKNVLKKIRKNILFLKNSDAVVSLNEFRKIKQQKKLIKTRIRYYKNKIRPLEKTINIKEAKYKEEMEKFEIAYRSQFENNILEFPNDKRKKA